ncbi:MAG: hypothetical protein ACFE9A_21285 [Candidatus Hodarchaeota archaeon]
MIRDAGRFFCLFTKHKIGPLLDSIRLTIANNTRCGPFLFLGIGYWVVGSMDNWAYRYWRGDALSE